MPPKSTKDAQSTMYNSHDNILTTKRRFEADLSQNVYDAWTNRTSERYLYAVYSHILSNLCNTIEPPNFPANTLSFSPQALFGTLKPPQGELGVEADKKLYKAQIPDYVRAIISREVPNKKTVRQLVDLWEIKELNTQDYWTSDQASRSAHAVMRANVEQVYHQAMSAFAHNSEWKQVHALLIVGVYFSQFVWQRPKSEIERPLPPLPSLSHLAPAQVPEFIKRIHARIAHYEARPLPKVVYYNAPVFVFHDNTPEPGGQVSLSPQFLYAVRLPLAGNKKFKFQHSWFSAPSNKPPSEATDEDSIERVNWELRDKNIEMLRLQINVITSPSTTASSSNLSGGYKPHYRLRKAAEQLSPLANRGQRIRNESQKLQLVVNSEGDSDSEHEDNTHNGEGPSGAHDEDELEYAEGPSGVQDNDEPEDMEEPSIYVEENE